MMIFVEIKISILIEAKPFLLIFQNRKLSIAEKRQGERRAGSKNKSIIIKNKLVKDENLKCIE